MKDSFFIAKEDGRIRAGALRAYLDALPNGSYKITVSSTSTKSTKQNSYLHVLFTIAAKHMNLEGYGSGMYWTGERVKLYAKLNELYPMEDALLPGGEVVQIAKDTRDLDKEEINSTIDRVIRHFAELGIVLPEPQEQTKLPV